MKCRHARLLLEREPLGELTLDERFRLEEHVLGCERCGREARIQASLGDMLASLPEPPVERLDLEHSLAAIGARIDEDSAARRDAGSARPDGGTRVGSLPRRTALAGGIAAVVVISVGLALWSVDRPASRADRLSGAGPIEPVERAEIVATTTVAEPPSIERPLEAAPTPPPGSPTEPALADLAPSDVDRERLAERRETVRAALRERRAVLAELGSAAFADGVDAALRPLIDEDWPVDRIVAGIARATPGPGGADETAGTELRIAALRYLGRRASRASLGELEDALEVPELARAAVHALADAGPDGRGRLVRAVWDPWVADTALGRLFAGTDPLARMDETELCAWVRAAFRSAPRDGRIDPGTAPRLLGELARSGRVGAGAALELGAHPLAQERDVFDALGSSPLGPSALVDALRSRRPPLERAVLLRAVAALRPPGALDWLVDQLADREHRAPALLALAAFDGTESARSLLRARRSARADRDLEDALRRALAHDAERFTQLAREAVGKPGASDPDALDPREMLALLLGTEHDGAVPAILVLVASNRLPDAERELAALTVAEIGRAEHETDLLEALERLGPRDRGVAAALLVSIRSLCGADTLRALFTRRGVEDAQRLLTLVESSATGDRRSLSLFRLAQYVEPLLTPTHDTP